MFQFFKCKMLQRIILVGFGCIMFSLLIAHGISASAKDSSPYYIKVNKQQNCVTIYEKDEDGMYTVPVKAMTCSTGWATPLGIYKTPVKYRWKLLMGGVWGQYSTRIVSGVLFHSVWYYKKDPSTLSFTQYNKLGTDASHGCIRLTVADAKWIYDNCPIGTTVEIYNSKNPGPLGKPDTLKLLAGTGWDPSDLDKNNPYLNKKPTIKGAKNTSVSWGTELDLLKGITALSTAGTDITSKLTVEENLDINTAGDYKVKYAVTDAIGRTRTKTITITVKAPDLQPTLVGVRDRYASEGTVIDREFALEGVTATVASKELPKENIQVNIIEDSEDSYTIEYSVTTKEKYTATASAKVIIDKNAPVLEGVYHKEITVEQLKTGTSGIKKLALNKVSVSDDYTKLTMKQVKVTVKAKSDYAFLITYEVQDKAGNVTKETVQYTYYKDVKFDGAVNLSVPYGTEITEEYAKLGVTVSNGTGDITDQVKVKIASYADDVYTVTYYVNNTDGSTISVVTYFTVEKKAPLKEE